MSDHKLEWRTKAHELAYPSHCAYCGSDKLPLLDSFKDTVDGRRLYTCERCLRLQLEAVDVVPAERHQAIVDAHNTLSASNRVAVAELEQLRRDYTATKGVVTKQQGELAWLRSQHAADTESVASMAAELRERRQNGGRTLAEVKAEIAAGAA